MFYRRCTYKPKLQGSHQIDLAWHPLARWLWLASSSRSIDSLFFHENYDLGLSVNRIPLSRLKRDIHSGLQKPLNVILWNNRANLESYEIERMRIWKASLVVVVGTIGREKDFSVSGFSERNQTKCARKVRRVGGGPGVQVGVRWVIGGSVASGGWHICFHKISGPIGWQWSFDELYSGSGFFFRVDWRAEGFQEVLAFASQSLTQFSKWN